MKYSQARATIKTGDLLAWSHGSLRSWKDFQVMLVRMFTRSEFSHVGIAWVANGRVFIIEAVGAGVRIYPLSREVPFYLCRKPTYLDQRAIDFLFERIGAPYSKIQAVLAGLGILTKGADDIWQCAELVLDALSRDVDSLGDINATPTAVVKQAMRQWGALEYIENDKEGA
ncbi:MAG: hypothetical protein ING73_11225 [Rhodocyclaceae bacterium]|nr:hypothetical protein [Rhodocyclaceae bacterium]